MLDDSNNIKENQKCYLAQLRDFFLFLIKFNSKTHFFIIFFAFTDPKKNLIIRAPLKIACDAHQDFKSFKNLEHKNLDDKRFPKSFRESLKG